MKPIEELRYYGWVTLNQPLVIKGEMVPRRRLRLAFIRFMFFEGIRIEVAYVLLFSF